MKEVVAEILKLPRQLQAKEIEIIYTTTHDKLIETCIHNNYLSLIELYYKKIELSPQELTKQYGNDHITLLHYAAQYGYDEITKTILETPEIDIQKLLEI